VILSRESVLRVTLIIQPGSNKMRQNVPETNQKSFARWKKINSRAEEKIKHTKV